MTSKNGLNIFFVIIAAISGAALLRKYEPAVFRFEDTLSSVIYMLYLFGFICSVAGLILMYRNRKKES